MSDIPDDIEDRRCTRCDSSNWAEIEGAAKLYPERRNRDKNKTEKRVFRCRSCDHEGRRFDDGQSSAITYAGALR